MLAVSWWFCALSLLGLALAYPDKPPVKEYPDLCSHMTPNHGPDPQTSPAPYSISLSSPCFKKNAIITVKLNNDSLDYYYEGFLVEARKPGKADNCYGQFKPAEETSIALKCFGKENSAIGHNAHQHFYAHTFTWTAPSDLEEDVQFVATVVKGLTTFWTGVTSATLVYNETCEVDVSDPVASSSLCVHHTRHTWTIITALLMIVSTLLCSK